jgi:O-antigen ligase
MERVNPYLNNIAFYLLLLFAFVPMLSNALATALAGCIFIIWIAQTLAYHRKGWMAFPLFKPICALIGLKLIVIIVVGYQGSFSRVLGQLAFPLIYFTLPQIVVTAERRRRIIWLLITGAVLASGIGLIKYMFAVESRISSTVSGYYTLATYLTIILSVVLTMFAFSKNWRERLFLGLVGLPLIAGIVFTYVRACYIAVAVVVIVLAIFKDRKLLILLGGVILSLVILSPSTTQKIIQRFDYRSENALSERDIIWKEGLQKADKVGFFGYGLNSFPILLDVKADTRIKDKSISTWHNLYLEALLDGGPLLLMIVLSIFVIQFRHSAILYRKSRDSEQKVAHFGILMVLLVLAIVGIFSDPLRDPIIAMLTWLLLGLSLV